MATAALLNTDNFEIKEGEEKTYQLEFSEIANDDFSYTYSFSVGNGTASSNDFRGGTGSGGVSVISSSPTSETFPINFSARSDSRQEDSETFFLDIALDGVQFSDGEAEKSFEIEIENNTPPMGNVEIDGTAQEDETLFADLDSVMDPEGLGDFSFQWLRDGDPIPGATSESYELGQADVDSEIELEVSYEDGAGVRERITSGETETVESSQFNATGSDADDTFKGGKGDDLIRGRGGDDRLLGNGGNDRIEAGDGTDFVNAGDGDDIVFGGASRADLRDTIYAGAGDDNVEGGFGNDLLIGMKGDDRLNGGFGVDELQGLDGNDTMNGAAFSDLVFGNAGDDFVNGGFGNDRINGGAGADKFFHIGDPGHGSDFIQDFSAGEGDTLLFGRDADPGDFRLNTTETQGAGQAGVEEAFVTYAPSGQILWALIDGAAQDEIQLTINGETSFDLMA